MLCSECDKKINCNSLCNDIERYLKDNRNYKTTYKNQEVSLSDKSILKHCNKIFNNETKHHEPNDSKEKIINLLPDIHEFVENSFTKKQKIYFQLFFIENKSESTIGKALNVSQQTVYQAIHGHPRNGGGITKKLKKILSSNSLNNKMLKKLPVENGMGRDINSGAQCPRLTTK
jgi:predicted DNA-binding protein YlxM (UPF0122 family)